MGSVVWLGLVVGAWARPEEIRLGAAPTTAHPMYAWSREDRLLERLIHEGLFEPDGRGGWRSDIVAAWSVDNALVTITLAKHKWHDGRPLVAADVCATIARVKATDRPTPYTAAANARIAECRTEDPDGPIVRITLVKPMENPQAALAFPLVPAHRGDWAGAGPQSPIEPIGLGPYTGEPDATGWSLKGDGSTRVKKVHLSVVPEPGKTVAEGRGIGAPFVDPPQLPTVRDVPGVELSVVPATTVWALFVNPTRGPLSEPGVRTALDLLIDRDHLASAAFGRDPQLATQPWTRVTGPFLARSPRNSPSVGASARDVEEARALLLAAGLVKTEQGWTWQGSPWTLRLATPLGLGPDPTALGAALSEDLDRQAVEVLPLSPTSWWFSLLAGGHVQSTDLALVPIDATDPGPWFHTRTANEGYYNPFGWSDPEIDAALSRIDETDQAQAFHARIADLDSALFLWSVDGRAAWRTGYGLDAFAPTPKATAAKDGATP